MLKPLTFISNSGVQCTGNFITITDSIEHRLNEFTFLNTDGSYYQNSSLTGKKLPINIVLNNTETELEKDLENWRKALNDNGVGELHHPDSTIGIVQVKVRSYSVSHDINQLNTINISIEFLEAIENLTSTQSATTISSEIELVKNTEIDNQLSNYSQVFNTASVIKGMQSTFEQLKSQFENAISQYSKSYQLFLDIISTSKAITDYSFNGIKKVLFLNNAILGSFELLQDNIESQVLPFFTLKDMIFNRYEYSEYELNITKDNAIRTINELKLLCLHFLINSSKVKFNDRDKMIYLLENMEVIKNDIIHKCFVVQNSFEQTDSIDFVQENNILHSLSIRCKELLLLQHKELEQLTELKLNKDTTIIELCAKYYNSVEIPTLKKFIYKNNIIGNELYLLKKNKVVYL